MTEHVKRFGFFVAALVFFALGIVALPTPLPIGFIFFVIGIALLVMSSTIVRGWFHRLRRRHGWVDRRMRNVEPHLPDEMREALTPDQTGEVTIEPAQKDRPE